MLSLPTDIQLLVLDYVSLFYLDAQPAHDANVAQFNLKSDLKALCLTSKAFRALALPRLYHSVVLETWSNEQKGLKRFVKSVAAGAGPHLRFTRSLAIEDIRPPAEPRPQVVCPLNFDASDLEASAADHDMDKVWNYLSLVLEMFRPNTLRTLR